MTKEAVQTDRANQQTWATVDISSAPVHSLPVLVIPVLADGSPDWERRQTGMMVTATRQQVQLDVEEAPVPLNGAFVVVVQMSDGTTYIAGLVAQTAREMENQHLLVEASWGGFAADLLRPENLCHRFIPESKNFRFGAPEEVLRKWADIGVLKEVVVDRVQVCPACHAVPTFRQGCTNCGSIHLGQDRFIHHLGCAHVGPVKDFEQAGELVCPKCRTRRLVPGSDYEYLDGPFTCQDCHWSDARLEDVGKCLGCDLLFPRYQVHEMELKGYDVDRLDSLVFLPQS